MYLIYLLLTLSPLYVRGNSATQKECKVSTYGTEFIFGFLDLTYYTPTTIQPAANPDLSVIMTSRTGTYVYITTFSTGSASKTPTPVTQSFYFHQFKELSFNSSFINKYQDTTSGGVIKIRSDDPIAIMTVYQMSTYTKINPILPINALASTYVIPSYKPNTFSNSENQFLVISLNDSTEVRFEGYETGNMVYQVKKEEIFIYEIRRDLSSTSASSNNPVAIFSSVMAGNQYTSGTKYGVSLSMQVPGMDRYATHFIVPSIDGQSINYYRVRIYAPSNNAFVKIYSTSADTMQVHVYHKIFYELTTKSTTVLEIVSDNPLLVVQIAEDSAGTALFMTNIPAASQFLTSYTTPAISGRYWNPSNKLIITIPTSEASGLIIDRKPVAHDPSQFAKKTPLGNFTVLVISNYASTSTITHEDSVPFGVLVVGQWMYNREHYAAGFQAGMQFTTDCQASSQTDISGAVVG